MSGASLPTDVDYRNDFTNTVLIPDEWGKSSDAFVNVVRAAVIVLIPDEWGKSSDATQT